MSTEATKSGISRFGSGDRNKDLNEKLFKYTVMVKEFLSTIPSSPEYHTIITHLTKSVCSLSTYSNDDKSVSSNPGISFRYLRESECWLRITKRHVKEINKSDLEYLIKESAELKNMIDTFIQKSQ